MSPDELLKVAETLAEDAEPGRPNQEELRRAVSTAYYALFHTLANNCADLIIGQRSAAQTNRAWSQTYRALEHGEVRRKYSNNPGRNILKTEFPEEIRKFTEHFVAMQVERHKADYDPLEAFTRSGVQQQILESRTAISGFEQADERDRRAFAAFILFPLRS